MVLTSRFLKGEIMSNETALYLKLLLHAGLIDDYNECLNQLLIEAPNGNGVLLELAFCNQDVNKSISLLRDYTYAKHVDQNVLFEKMRVVFQKHYLSQAMTQAEILEAMHVAAINAENDMEQPWESVKNLMYYYEEVVDGYYDEDFFHEQFLDLLMGHKRSDA